MASSLHLPLFCRRHHRKLPSLGLPIRYMQDTGSITIKRWLGCEATRMPIRRRWRPISASHGTSLLQLTPRAPVPRRADRLGPPLTITWTPRPPTAVTRILQGLGSTRTSAKKTKSWPRRRKRRRRRRTASQMAGWSVT